MTELSPRFSAEGSARVTLQAGGLTFVVRSDAACASGLRRFARAWCLHVDSSSDPAGGGVGEGSPSNGPFAPSPVHAELYCQEADQCVVFRAGPLIEKGQHSLAHCHWAVEQGLVHYLMGYRPPGTKMLHASCVLREGAGLLFVGPSGAGKSSLCLAALARGYSYLADDVVLTDGRALWGVPRALQFDPPSRDAAFPGWLERASLDHHTYGSPAPHDSYARPLFIPAGMTIHEASTQDFCVVRACYSTSPRISPLSGAEIVAELIDASYQSPTNVDFGRLASGGGFDLRWCDPHDALSSLEVALEARRRRSLET